MTANPDLAGIYVTAGGPFGAAAGSCRCWQSRARCRWCRSTSSMRRCSYVQDGVIYGTIGQDPFAQGHDPAIRLFNFLVGGVMPECGA